MRAALDDPPGVEHEDLIGVADRREAVRDRDRGAPARELIQRLLDSALGLGVQRRGRLVEDQHRRVAKDRARDRDALLLAAREAVSALADRRVVALRQRGDQLVYLGRLRGLFDLLVARLRAGEAQVLADRGVEQVGLLGDEPTVAASESSVTSRMSTPSMVTHPAGAHTGARRGSASVVLPEPVSPTSAVRVPAGISAQISASVHGASGP